MSSNIVPISEAMAPDDRIAAAVRKYRLIMAVSPTLIVLGLSVLLTVAIFVIFAQVPGAGSSPS